MTSNGGLHFAARTLPSSGLEGAFRVHVLPEHLDQVGLKLGDLCEITDENGEAVGHGISWRATDKMGTNPKVRPVKMTETLRAAYGIKDGSHVNLSRTDAKLVYAEKVVLTDMTEHAEEQEGFDGGNWPIRIAYALCNCEVFANGVTFEVTAKKGIKKRFYIEQVKSASPPSGPSSLYFLNGKTEIVIHESASIPVADGPSDDDTQKLLTDDDIGGLVGQLQELNKRLKRAVSEAKDSRTTSASPNQSILIHGFEGTGKSFLLSRLEQKRICRTMRLKKSMLETNIPKNRDIIRNTFDEAKKKQPSIILMDDINKIAPADDETYVDTIIDGINSLTGSRVLVIATCRSVSDVNSALLKTRRFSALIELPVPDRKAREQILNILIGKEDDSEGHLAKTISSRTHGFTGGDLALLVEIAESFAFDRNEENEQTRRNVGPNGSGEKSVMRENGYVRNGSQISAGMSTLTDGRLEGSTLHEQQQHQPLTAPETSMNGHLHATAHGENTTVFTIDDFTAALAKVQPTAIREFIFEKPKTTWADIGGSQHIQQRLDRIILWPLEHGRDMKALNKQAKKGVLLYGPPGCSKTLTAQAIATKYGLNFIAIKGGELISMYVGESERSIRDLFRKARAAKPCVIFFDEIDSIASVRESTASKGMNVLTTLLTEMDGFNALDGVLVLAATNRPEVLDPAIMRPGRFDAHMYLGLPNAPARKEILQILARGVPGEDSLDFEALSTATEGYTGAEMAKIYDLATDAVLERRIGHDGSINNDEKLSMADFEVGIEQTKQGVTSDMLEAYEMFRKK